MQPNIWQRFLRRLALTISPDLREGQHWTALNRPATPTRQDPAQAYKDALDAWQYNPYAKRIIDLITDFTIGDGLTPAAPGDIGRFIDRFWNHPENNLALRLPDLMDELSRSGDLFLVLFRNPADGLSYVRPLPKSEIQDIITAPLDWEKEIEIIQRPTQAGERPIVWRTQHHPDAAEADAIMLHYSINRPVGALLGESELSTLIPWLNRYSRMLEDRVRLNWAARSFLWFVRVPTSQVQAKAEQYSAPPEPGSIIVHDDGEQWDMKTPALHANDASRDLLAIRQLIAAGSGQPPHWHGDGGDVNLSTAKAMNDPAIRHLRRRQRHLQYMIIDLCQVAYQRAYEIGRGRTAPKTNTITVELPDISREDNADLAGAAAQLAGAFSTLLSTTYHPSPTLRHRILTLIFRFAGEQLTPAELEEIDNELAAAEQQQEQPSQTPEDNPA